MLKQTFPFVFSVKWKTSIAINGMAGPKVKVNTIIKATIVYVFSFIHFNPGVWYGKSVLCFVLLLFHFCYYLVLDCCIGFEFNSNLYQVLCQNTIN